MSYHILIHLFLGLIQISKHIFDMKLGTNYYNIDFPNDWSNVYLFIFWYHFFNFL